MRLSTQKYGKKTRGQTMVEFALVLPLLLFIMFGIMEFGRLLFIYITTASATREAARYAAAVGISENGVPYYNDCAGIRAAAQRVGILAGIQDSDVVIQYDRGPDDTSPYTGCPAPAGRPRLGERIVVTVTGHFDLIVPIIPIEIQDITSTTARTIIRDLTVGDSFVIGYQESEEVPPPYVHFSGSFTPVDEPATTDPVTVHITVDKYDPESIQIAPIVVTIDIVDIFEAKPGVDFDWGGPITLTFNPEDETHTFPISIRHDDLHELTERIVLYIKNVSNGNIGYPRLHVISINDNDSTLPYVNFESLSSQFPENHGEFLVNVILSQTGTQASVRFRFLEGELVPGVDFTYSPADNLLVFGILDNDNRTASQVQQIRINPTDDDEPTGHRTAVIELHSPGEAEIREPFQHTFTLIDDDSCNITISNVVKSGNFYYIDLFNNVHPDTEDGVSDTITGMRMTYTRTGTPPALQEILFKSNMIYFGNAESPVVIPSIANQWSPSADLSLPLPYTTPGNLAFRFSNQNVVSIDSLSIDFEICGTVNLP